MQQNQVLENLTNENFLKKGDLLKNIFPLI